MLIISTSYWPTLTLRDTYKKHHWQVAGHTFYQLQEVPVQISRLLHAHEMILLAARSMAKPAAKDGDDGTNDLLVSDVIRTSELHVWFVSEHVVDVPLVRTNGKQIIKLHAWVRAAREHTICWSALVRNN